MIKIKLLFYWRLIEKQEFIRKQKQNQIFTSNKKISKSFNYCVENMIIIS